MTSANTSTFTFKWQLASIRKWHWMSAALCFGLMLLFSSTGILLHHSRDWLPKPQVTKTEGALPASLLAEINQALEQGDSRLPAAAIAWFAREKNIPTERMRIEPPSNNAKNKQTSEQRQFSDNRPGKTITLSIQASNGSFTHEVNDRGWLGYFNDLHKGKNTGIAWIYLTDLFAVACIVFSITGFLLLQRYANTRAETWKLFGSGLILPILFMVFFIH